MQIELKTLFIYRQYVDSEIWYFFDKKNYTIVDADSRLSVYDEPYERYIPLFQIDEMKIENDYIHQLNNKKILRQYNQRDICDICFEEFIQKYSMWDSWIEFYEDKVYQIAIDWCNDNHIRYVK